MIENGRFVCISACLLCGFCANSEKNKTLANNERDERRRSLDDCRRSNDVSDSSLIHKSSFCSMTMVYIVFVLPRPEVDLSWDRVLPYVIAIIQFIPSLPQSKYFVNSVTSQYFLLLKWDFILIITSRLLNKIPK